MAVLNRALTLATRGLLTGAAITIATQGYIQLPSSGTGINSNSKHSHISTANYLTQNHFLKLLDSVHGHRSTESDVFKLPPPIYIPPSLAAPFPSGTTFIDYGIPYKYTSFLNFQLSSNTEYKLKLVENEQFKSSFNSVFILYSDTDSRKVAYFEAYANSNVALHTDNNVKFSDIDLFNVNPEFKITSKIKTSFLSPKFGFVDVEPTIELSSESTFTFYKADAPVPIVNNINSYSKNNLLIIDLSSNFKEFSNTVNSSLFNSNIDFRISNETIYSIETKEITSIQFEKLETFAIYSETEFNYKSIQQKLNSMNSIIDMNLNIESSFNFVAGKQDQVEVVQDNGDDEVILLSLIAALMRDS